MSTAQTPENELQPHLEILAQAAEALNAGRAPRARNPLKKAARALAAAGQHDRAEEAHRLLARLELRMGNARLALNAGRAALRAAKAQGRESSETLTLLAWLYSATSDVKRALQTARRVLEASNGDARVLCDAWVLVSEVEASTGDLARSITSAEAALQSLPEGASGEAQLQAGWVLLRSGCTQEAESVARTVSLKAGRAEVTVRAQLLRGNAKLHMGALDGASRYLRAASRGAREVVDGRLEVLALGALGAVERVRRGSVATRGADPLVKAARLARKLKDVRVLRIIEQLERDGLGPAPFPNPKAAAGRLVSLSNQIDSQMLNDACLREVQYLGSLDPQGAPYPYPPLPLDLPLL